MHAPSSSAPKKHPSFKSAVLAGLLGLAVSGVAFGAAPMKSATPGGSDTEDVLEQNSKGLTALEKADKALAELDAQQLQMRRLLDRINTLTSQIKSNNVAIAGLAKLEPKGSLENLAKQTATAKGENGPSPWFPGDPAPVPSLAMVQKTINDLQQQVQSLQGKRSDLEKQRNDLSLQGEQFDRKSQTVTGKPSLDLYVQGAEARKKAADLSVQVDQTDAQLMETQQDLQLAQAQQKALDAAITRLDDAVKQTNGGWDSIQKQMGAFNQLSKTILGDGTAPPPATQPTSTETPPTNIAEAWTRLQALAKQADGNRDEAVKQLNAAISAFNQAATKSRTIASEYSGYLTARSTAAEAPAWQLMAMIFNVGSPTFDKGQAELRLAQLYANQAYTLTAMQSTVANLGEALSQAHLALNGFPENPAKAFEGERNEAVEAARKSFGEADTDLEKASGGGATGDIARSTQSAAKITHAIELYAQSLLLKSIGATDDANKALAQAHELANGLQNVDVVLPTELAPKKETPEGGAGGNGLGATGQSAAGATDAAGGATTAPTTNPTTQPAGGQ